jgi:transposase-like protein
MKNKQYPLQTREKAKCMYLNGESFRAIAREIGCTESTIRYWCRKENWAEYRAQIYSASSAVVAEKTIGLLSEEMLGHIKAYQDLQRKGLEALRNAPVKSAREAAELIDKGIKGERSIAPESLSLRFLEEVANVIKSEVNDPEVIQRIASRFRSMGSAKNQGLPPE